MSRLIVVSLLALSLAACSHSSESGKGTSSQAGSTAAPLQLDDALGAWSSMANAQGRQRSDAVIEVRPGGEVWLMAHLDGEADADSDASEDSASGYKVADLVAAVDHFDLAFTDEYYNRCDTEAAKSGQSRKCRESIKSPRILISERGTDGVRLDLVVETAGRENHNPYKRVNDVTARGLAEGIRSRNANLRKLAIDVSAKLAGKWALVSLINVNMPRGSRTEIPVEQIDKYTLSASYYRYNLLDLDFDSMTKGRRIVRLDEGRYESPLRVLGVNGGMILIEIMIETQDPRAGGRLVHGMPHAYQVELDQEGKSLSLIEKSGDIESSFKFRRAN